MNKLLLAIDIDGTLIPNSSKAPNVEGIKEFCQLIKDLNAVLIYPTGRNFEMTCEAIGEFFLPRPDFLITDNGIRLFLHNGSGWEENLEYRDFLAKAKPNFDREKITKILSKLPYLQEQEIAKQHKLKASFYTDLDKQPLETVGAVKKIFQEWKVNNIKITYSQDLRNNVGILEILPDNVSKLTGIRYLSLRGASISQSKIATRQSRDIQDSPAIIFAGDEGNDLDVFASGISSILVGNAREEIKTAVREMGIDSVYFAEKNEVEGVLEGLKQLSMFNEQ